MRPTLLIALALACCAALPAASCQALLVGGEPGSPLYQRRFQDWLTRFQTVLVKSGVAPADIRILSADPSFRAPIVGGPATAAAILEAIGAIAATAGRDDQFVLVLMGHSSNVEGVGPRLILPGADLAPEPLTKALAAIRCRQQVVINLSGVSGEFVTTLAAAERVNIAASSAGEQPEPVFGEFFLRALESGRADGDSGGPKDGVVDCLEAFTWASRETVRWIARLRYNSEAGHWRIDGRDSVAVFEHLFSGISGVPGSRKLDPESDRNAADAVPVIQPPDGVIDATWSGRRMIDEHAVLEDCGVAEAVSGLSATGFTVFPANEPLQPGWLARRTVIGHPAPAPNPTKP
jgi:hypothetical protein